MVKGGEAPLILSSFKAKRVASSGFLKSPLIARNEEKGVVEKMKEKSVSPMRGH